NAGSHWSRPEYPSCLLQSLNQPKKYCDPIAPITPSPFMRPNSDPTNRPLTSVADDHHDACWLDMNRNDAAVQTAEARGDSNLIDAASKSAAANRADTHQTRRFDSGAGLRAIRSRTEPPQIIPTTPPARTNVASHPDSIFSTLRPAC